MSSESRGYYRNKPPTEQPSTIPQPDSRAVAKQQGYTGDLCSQCGGVHMMIAGHCYVCQDCGTSTGCS